MVVELLDALVAVTTVLAPLLHVQFAYLTEVLVEVLVREFLVESLALLLHSYYPILRIQLRCTDSI